MKTIEINGVEVRTNFGGKYPFSDGNDKKTMVMQLSNWGESDEQMLHRLVKKGYRTVTFYYTTTRVKGCYNLIAFCRR